MNNTHIIAPQTGASFTMKKGEILTVIDPQGEQVSDMVLFKFTRHKGANILWENFRF